MGLTILDRRPGRSRPSINARTLSVGTVFIGSVRGGPPKTWLRITGRIVALDNPNIVHNIFDDSVTVDRYCEVEATLEIHRNVEDD